MFKLLSTAAALALASAAIAQTAQPGQTTPSVTPSDTPAVTPSQSPAATPSQSPAATPSQTPAATPSQSPSVPPYSRPPMLGESAVGGMSKCENMIGSDKDKCLQEERAAASTGGRAAGAGGSHAPGSTGTGAGTMGSQPTAPAGTIR